MLLLLLLLLLCFPRSSSVTAFAQDITAPEVTGEPAQGLSAGTSRQLLRWGHRKAYAQAHSLYWSVHTAA
jgi:hypothetical protein